MADAKSTPKFDKALVNELARVLFITDQTLPEGKTCEDVREERKQAWNSSKNDYAQKARKILNVSERRQGLTVSYVAPKVEVEDLEGAES